jgi:flagella basal body P-ring formation protein FlgA
MLRTQGQVWDDGAETGQGSATGEKTQAVVLRQAARKGQMITKDMLELAQFDRAPAHGFFVDPAAIIGRRLTSNVGDGVPVRDRHLQPDWAIEEGQRIAIETDIGGITVASSGIAIENGSIGDIISVRNISSNKLLQGIVADKNKISVIANMN